MRTIGVLAALAAIGAAGCEPPERADPAPVPAATPTAASVPPIAAADDPLADWRGGVAARGTEPFWRFDAHPGGVLAFEAMGTETTTEAPYVEPAATDGGLSFASGAIRAVIRPGQCSDGMSDIVYPASAEVTAQGQTWRGCAYPRWDRALVALLPQIDACLAASPEKGPVILARVESEGVRVRIATGETRFECLVSPGDGARVLRSGASEEPLAGERNPTFHRAPGENPGGECYKAEDVRGEGDELLGWLADPQGC